MKSRISTRREELSLLFSDKHMLKYKIHDIIREIKWPSSTETMPEKLLISCSTLKVIFLNIMIISGSSRKGGKVNSDEAGAMGHATYARERTKLWQT